jgi:hypothetical protein
MYSTRLFDYQDDSKTFVTDISDLPGQVVQLDVIYADAVDTGIVLESHKTGETCRYVLDETAVNEDDDVMYWSFRAVDKVGKGTFVKIFNY